jgi:hypothetical protein
MRSFIAPSPLVSRAALVAASLVFAVAACDKKDDVSTGTAASDAAQTGLTGANVGTGAIDRGSDLDLAHRDASVVMPNAPNVGANAAMPDGTTPNGERRDTNLTGAATGANNDDTNHAANAGATKTGATTTHANVHGDAGVTAQGANTRGSQESPTGPVSGSTGPGPVSPSTGTGTRSGSTGTGPVSGSTGPGHVSGSTGTGKVSPSTGTGPVNGR